MCWNGRSHLSPPPAEISRASISPQLPNGNANDMPQMQSVLHRKMYTFVFRYHLLQETWLLQGLGDLSLDSFPFTDGRRDFCYSQSRDELGAHGSWSTALSPPQPSLLLKRIPKDKAGTWLFFSPDQLLETRIDVRHFLCFVATCLQ